MAAETPAPELAQEFSEEHARPTPWKKVRKALEEAEVYWLTTVRQNGQANTAPLIGVFTDHAFYFCTGGNEQKNKNIQRNPHVSATTGCNSYGKGLDVVIEGDAVLITDQTKAQHVADAYAAKYDDPIWHFEVREAKFYSGQAKGAIVYEVAPRKVFAFERGKQYSQTRLRFG